MEADVKTVKSKSLIRRYFEINLLYKILAGLILGAIFGAIFQTLSRY
ncbi:MAG: hypothetical protein ACFNTA_10345 [Campylobacter sp.]